MANVNQALELIRKNQLFLLASYIDNARTSSWLLHKDNRHHLQDVSIMSNILLSRLKTKGNIRTIVGGEKLITKVNSSIYNNLPDELEKEFVESLIGTFAAEAFFKSVYPLYRVEKKEKIDSVKPLPIDYERLGRILELNTDLCFAIELWGQGHVGLLIELNAELPKDIVPDELIAQNNNAVLPQFKCDEPQTSICPPQKNIGRSPSIRPSMSSSFFNGGNNKDRQGSSYDFFTSSDLNSLKK